MKNSKNLLIRIKNTNFDRYSKVIKKINIEAYWSGNIYIKNFYNSLFGEIYFFECSNHL